MLRQGSMRTEKNGHFPSLFDDGFFSDFFRPGLVTRAGTQWPSVDIKEYQDKYVLHADVPGYDEKDIKVEFADGQLVIQASRAEEKEENGTDFTVLVSERTQSMFRRSFAVGDGINPEKIEASYKNGTLTLTLPKSEKVLPRVIPISLKHK